MVHQATGSPVQTLRAGIGQSWFAIVEDPAAVVSVPDQTHLTLPVDDWPFVYLPERAIPRAYLVALVLLAGASVLMLRRAGLTASLATPQLGHFFFLGAAFLLVEISAINRLALLFGTTWIVSAVTIAIVLGLVAAANGFVATGWRLPTPAAYGLLIVSLIVGWSLPPALVLGRSLPWAFAYGAATLLPVFFAGMIFSRSFEIARGAAAPALGANILDSVLGGWSEYVSMLIGIRALSMVALVLYLASGWCLLRQRQGEDQAASA